MHDRLVTPQEAGMRLDRFLAAAEEVGTRARAERLLEAGEVLVDGGRRPKSFRLVEGATVTFPGPEPATLDLEPVDIDVPVLYEDDWLMVVDKPAGLLV